MQVNAQVAFIGHGVAVTVQTVDRQRANALVLNHVSDNMTELPGGHFRRINLVVVAVEKACPINHH